METREEKLATWADPAANPQRGVRVLTGSIPLDPHESEIPIRMSEDKIRFDQIESQVLNAHDDIDSPSRWNFKVISLPRLKLGRLVLSIPRDVYQKIQDAWNLHPRTIEMFLSNNGVVNSSHDPVSGRSSVVLKVANSRSTGFDCVSVTSDPASRTTYVLYHHLRDDDAVFATLLSTPELCIDSHFFVSALYRLHHQAIEFHRNTIDCAIQGIERETGFGNPGRLGNGGRPSMDEYPALDDPKKTIQQLSYCQTDLACIGHAARCCLECGGWLVTAIDDRLRDEQSPHPQFSEHFRIVRLRVREEVEYMRRRTVTLLSQVEQMTNRTQSQTSFMLSLVTQSDAEYTAAIAVDGKRDSIAMKTISILGIVYLPATFVATLFSIDMFNWGVSDASDGSLSTSPSMWVYWAVAIPLTVITFLVWIFWSKRENRKSAQRFTIFRSKPAAERESTSGMETDLVPLVTGEKIV